MSMLYSIRKRENNKLITLSVCVDVETAQRIAREFVAKGHKGVKIYATPEER